MEQVVTTLPTQQKVENVANTSLQLSDKMYTT